MFSEKQRLSTSFKQKSFENSQKPTKTKRKITISAAKLAPFSTTSRSPAKPCTNSPEFCIKPELIESYLDEKTQVLGFSAKKPTKKREFPQKQEISQQSLEIIEKIAEKSKNSKKTRFFSNTSDKCSEILNKPSLKDKYQELLSQNTEFLLPAHYKSLLKVFEAMDETLQFMRLRNEPQFLCFIKENLRMMGQFVFFRDFC